jgi:hypothetical protein
MNEEQAAAYRNDLDLTRVSHLFELVRGRRKEVADLTLLGLKTLILLNGGAIVALFTVLAHFDQLTVVGWRLWVAFGVFCSGVVFALTSLLLGFLSSNSNSFAEQADADFIYFHSRGENETASKLKAQREKTMKSGLKLWISADFRSNAIRSQHSRLCRGLGVRPLGREVEARRGGHRCPLNCPARFGPTYGKPSVGWHIHRAVTFPTSAMGRLGLPASPLGTRR